jgi:hypothetical protein
VSGKVGVGRSPTHPDAATLGWVGRVGLLALLAVGIAFSSADPFTVLFFSTFAATGAFLVFRRPDNSIGWLLLAIGFGSIGTTTPPSLDLEALQRGTASTSDELRAWLGSWSGSATIVGLLALMILFPSGHFPEGRWRRPAIAITALSVAIVLLASTAPTLSFNPDGGATEIRILNPVALFPDLPLWDLFPTRAAVLPIIFLLAVGAVSMLVRYRRATGALKFQLRWLAAAVTFTVGAVVSGLTMLAVLGDSAWFRWIPAIVAYPAIPIAIGIAVLRYRLYEIDRIISRTIGWAVVTGLLVGTFAVLVVGLQAIIEPLTDGNTLAIAGSTLVVAALFAPLRSRVQRAVDRRFDRSRYDGERLLAGFGERLRDEVDLPTISREARSTVDAAVRPASVRLWLRDRSEGGA